MADYKIKNVGEVRLIDRETGRTVFEGTVSTPTVEQVLKSSKEFLELFLQTQKYGGSLSDCGMNRLEELIKELEFYV